MRSRLNGPVVSRLPGTQAPDTRMKPLEGCTMPIFDELRDPNLKLAGNAPPPPLFDFKPQELFEHAPSIKSKLIPDWYRQQNQ